MLLILFTNIKEEKNQYLINQRVHQQTCWQGRQMAARPVTSPSQSAGRISSDPASSQTGQVLSILVHEPAHQRITDYHRTALQFKNKQTTTTKN